MTGPTRSTNVVTLDRRRCAVLRPVAASAIFNINRFPVPSPLFGGGAIKVARPLLSIVFMAFGGKASIRKG